MSRRLPAGNGVVGHDGRDDPGRALGGGARAGGEPALAVSVPLVAGLAGLVGPGVHDLVDQGFGHYPQQLGEVDHVVVESGHLGPVARDLVYIVHMRLLPFYEF